MIAWLANQWRMAKCEHDWREVRRYGKVFDETDTVPYATYSVEQCSKCGYTKKTRI